MNNNNNPTPPPPQYYDDEISLIDLWNTLMRRKKLLIGAFLIVVIAAGIYLLLAKPVYESQAMIQVGQVGQVGQVEDINMLQQRLTAEYSELKSVEINRSGAKGVVTLITTGYDREQSRKSLQQVVDELLITHRNRYHDMLSPLQQRQDSYERRLTDYKHQLSELDLQINRLRGEAPTQAAILMIEKGNITRAMPQLEDKIAELQFATSEPQSMPTRQIGDTKSPEHPVKPKPGLVMTLSIILGLMLGIFAAFFAEFIAKARVSQSGTPM